MTVEVFKTNVDDTQNAERLVAHIHRNFSGIKANFDLDDCDNILRIVSIGQFDSTLLIDLVNAHGFVAELLPD